MSQDRIEFWVSGEWTMVYLNGELQQAGDHYLADEWLQERMGVEVVQDDAGFCIPDGHSALRSLTEVQAAMEEAAERTRRAEELRAQADALRSEADRIEAR